MLYLDASLLTTLISTEERTSAAHAWLEEVDSDLLTSEWALTEVASALSIKQRRGELDVAGRARAENVLTAVVDAMAVLPLLAADFRAATGFVRTPERNLRGPDALHIAVADRVGATLQTLDEAQAAAAWALGVDAVITVERA